MTDEKFCFVSDLREKKKTATGAHHKRTHCGKGGAVKFPSDYLSKKELKNMSGEVQSYRLNDPMKWDEFKAMPDDLKVAYIKALRTKFNVPDKEIADMFGVDRQTVGRWFRCLGLGLGKCAGGWKSWNKEYWLAFVNGVPVPACSAESVEASFKEDVEKVLASIEDIFEPVPVPEIKTLPVREEKARVIPRSGTMTLEGRVEDVLNTVSVLLGGADVHITITWEQAGVSDG